MARALTDLLEEIKDASVEVEYVGPWHLKITGYRTSRPEPLYATTQKQLAYRGIDVAQFYSGVNRENIKKLIGLDKSKAYSDTFLAESKGSGAELLDKLKASGLLIVMNDGEVLEITRRGLKDWGLGRRDKETHCFDVGRLNKSIEERTLEYIENYILDVIDANRGIPGEINLQDLDDVIALLSRNNEIMKTTSPDSGVRKAVDLIINYVKLWKDEYKWAEARGLA